MRTPWLRRDRTAKRGLLVCLALLSIAAASVAGQRSSEPALKPPTEGTSANKQWIAYFEGVFRLSKKAETVGDVLLDRLLGGGGRTGQGENLQPNPWTQAPAHQDSPSSCGVAIVAQVTSTIWASTAAERAT